MPPSGRRPGTELLPGLSLTKALALVMGVWVTCTLIMFHQHSFVAVSRFDYSDQVLSSLPMHALKVSHIAEIITHAAQSVSFVPIEDDPKRPYALVLVANYFGSSGLFLLRPNARRPVQPLAILQTECGHSWAVWRQGGRRWAAVANYCSKDKHKGVVVYELEPLTGSGAQIPDWGFKAAAAISANGSSYVLHMKLPLSPESSGGLGSSAEKHGFGSKSGSGSAASAGGALSAGAGGGNSGMRGQAWQDVLAVAEYGSGHWVLYGLEDNQDKGLMISELQRGALRGVAALAVCSTGGEGDGSGGGGSGNGVAGDFFLVGLSYYDKGFATRSAVYRWHPGKRQFLLLQVLATHGAHGARCFTIHEANPTTTTTTTTAPATAAAKDATASDSGTSTSNTGTGNRSTAAGSSASLFLAIANSRHGDSYAANSTLWRYDPGSGRFLLHQTIVTVGAHDVQHLRLPASGTGATTRMLTRARAASPVVAATRVGRAAGAGAGAGVGGSSDGGAGVNGAAAEAVVDVLVFANRGADQLCSPQENSPLLTWVSERQRFEPAAHLAGLQCATGLAAGRLGGSTLLLATGDRTANGTTAGPLTHVWKVEVARARQRKGGAHRWS